MQVAKTTYPVIADFQFLLHYLNTIHQRYIQADRRMDVMIRSISVTFH